MGATALLAENSESTMKSCNEFRNSAISKKGLQLVGKYGDGKKHSLTVLANYENMVIARNIH